MLPEDKITVVKGVGAKSAEYLKRIGIETVGDFLAHYPRDYRHYMSPISVEETAYDEKLAAYRVKITQNPKMVRRGNMVLVTLDIGTGEGRVSVNWYHTGFIRGQLKIGETWIFYGKMVRKGKRRILEHPEIIGEVDYERLSQSLQPIYPLTEGLSQKFFARTMHEILEKIAIRSEVLPLAIRQDYQLAEYNFAVQQIHFPKDEVGLQIARKRLVFEEFLTFILAMKLLAKENKQLQNGYVIEKSEAADRLIQNLPYALTGAQKRVWQEVAQDMSGKNVMNRLIQGDVGSGKTMIAALALLSVAVSGYQGCMMAPTEVLARQHDENLRRLFAPFGVETVLLTGSMTAAQRREAYARIEDGRAGVIIGTQALFQEKVHYHRLALIVTDEQHRFGVRQRERLTDKSIGYAPHVLVMSATPIPRTLALILYSDLNVSVIDEKPSNRLPVKNTVVGENYRPAAWRFIEKQVQMGHQAYVICPMVEESEKVDAENVQDYAKKLKEALDTKIKIAVLHGKMRSEEKNDIMACFARGEIQVLVSTTVIEVGVDVPNTTVMLIENAERFGLAQLHQLRGRVGRGSAQSYCIFLYGHENEKIKERLSIMAATNDGFKIAEEDLKLRGPGDMFGIRQSGSLIFKLGDVFEDAAILMEAARASEDILRKDCELCGEEYVLLKECMQTFLRNGEQVIL